MFHLHTPGGFLGGFVGIFVFIPVAKIFETDADVTMYYAVVGCAVVGGIITQIRKSDDL